ncbi:MAG: TadE/TadG family type IV pilus assembly protein [Blastocatellia bacterium]|nr:TadE/TadG family type IV pilus assembly protein [Blastocatellia bacterium]
MTKSMRRGRRQERGIQMVELSVVLPAMFMLIAIIAEFGNYYHTFNTLSKATRAAARYISTKDLTTAEIAKAKNLAVCGSLSTCSTSVLTNFTTSNVNITYTGNAIVPQTVTVAVTGFTYQPLFDLSKFASTLIWNNVPVKSSTTMRHGFAD